jgi:hypothetical protein
VLGHLNDLAISKVAEELHYMICDIQNDCAVVELNSDNSQLIPVTRGALPVKILTNTQYSLALQQLKDTQSSGTYFDPSLDIYSDDNSMDRFLTVAAELSSHSKEPVDFFSDEMIVDLLSKVAQPDFTRWQIIYKPREKSVRYRIEIGAPLISVSLSDFDLSPKGAVLGRNIEESIFSENSELGFRPFTAADNYSLVDKSMVYLQYALPENGRKVLETYFQGP